MQEDKEGMFDAIHALSLCIAATNGMVLDMTPDRERMKASAGYGYSTATDLADWLVRSLDMPFRQAHHVTGSLVAMAAERGCELEELSLADMQSVEPAIHDGIFAVLGVENSVASRTSYGGTSPKNVAMQAERWLKMLAG